MAKIKVEETLLQAQAREKRGEFTEARELYESVLLNFPGNRRAQARLARMGDAGCPPAAAPAEGTEHQARLKRMIALVNAGQPAEAAAEAAALEEVFPGAFPVLTVLGVSLQQLGRQEEAIAAFRRAALANPGLADAQFNLGKALQDAGDAEAAMDCYRDALIVLPEHVDALNNLGMLLHLTDRLDEAAEVFGRALELQPDNASVLNNLGIVHKAGKALDEAVESFRAALQLQPGFVGAHINLGNALQDLKQSEEAIACYARALELDPSNVEAQYNMACLLQTEKRTAEAIAAYQRIIDGQPDHVAALNNLSVAQLDRGDAQAALATCRRVLRLQPDHAEAYNNMGNALYRMGRLEEARDCYFTALRLGADDARALLKLGAVLVESRRHKDAVEAFARALELAPDTPDALAHKMHQQCQLADPGVRAEFAEVSARLGITWGAVQPFATLALEDSPERQMRRSIRWAERQFGELRTLPARPRPRTRRDRLRIGYFSADFHDHATMFLMSGLLREHDRSRFELIAYAYGQTTTGRMRGALDRSVDTVRDVQELEARQIAELAHEDAIDIAVDLKGYTQNARLAIFGHRPAPVQISYLGYPGTIGAPFFDYIVGDPVVIPEAERRWYTEKVIYLPHSYQPNDNRRSAERDGRGRADHSLPEDAVVLSCHNQTYKIGPEELSIWLRVLRDMPQTVLWLLESNETATEALRAAARAAGVDPERLVFAARASNAEHNARQHHADLFVDTFCYNAHTTASDALWAGVPVATMAGRQFSARVAASLVTAAGLPDLVADTPAAYETLIRSLVGDPDRLAGLRRHLVERRGTDPLFDTVRYARDFERALDTAYGRYLAGQPPADIRLAPA